MEVEEWDKNCAEKSPRLIEQRLGERKRPVCLQGRHEPERVGDPAAPAAEARTGGFGNTQQAQE